MFHFTRFSVRHDRCAVKVGTDALLLGGWADFSGAQRILDIGTGCGVLALIAAQRNTAALIDAVDVDDDAVAQAAENFAHSPWPDRLRAHRIDVRRMRTPHRYDLIICNPPYYDGGMASPDERRAVARHAGSLTLVELLSAAAGLMSENGRLSLILPCTREKDLVAAARTCGLPFRKRCEVRYGDGRAPKRLLLEAGRLPMQVMDEAIAVAGEDGIPTADYRRLLSEVKGL